MKRNELWRAKQGKPMYGSAQPARLLSGRLRHAAYRVPEHKARRWMLLMLADRLDRLEHLFRRRRVGWLALLAFAVGGGYAATAMTRRAR